VFGELKSTIKKIVARNAKNINEFKNLLDKDPKRLIFSYDFDKQVGKIVA